jgi:hypothetical protein
VGTLSEQAASKPMAGVLWGDDSRPSPFQNTCLAWSRIDSKEAALSVNRLHSLVESYSLATKQSAPPGQILVHSQIIHNKRKLFEGLRNPVRRGHRFRCKADSIPVIADSA